MSELICIDDEEDNYANDLRNERYLRPHTGRHENEKDLNFVEEDERSLRRLRRHSVKMKRGLNCKGTRKKVDENYAFFLNYFASVFEDTDCVEVEAGAEDDLQYGKFLSFLKPYKTSYVLDFGGADGMSNKCVYEDDDDMVSDLPMLDYVSANVLDSGNGQDFKSASEPSETHERSATKDIIGRENAGHEKSFIDSPELTSLKSVQVRSIDVSYLFYLGQILNGKHAKKLSCFQGSKKRKIMSGDVSATKTTPRNEQGKKPRLSKDSGEGMKTTMDAKVSQPANGDQKYGMPHHLRQKKKSKHAGEPRHCRNLRNSRHKNITTNATQKYAGMQGENDKQHKRYHQLAVDHKNNDRMSVTPKANQEANGTAVPLRETPDDKLVKNHRLSESSEPATKRTLTDCVDKDSAGQHALHASQSSRKKSSLKNHNQPGSLLAFNRPINESYKAFLSGLSEYEGNPVFRSNEGKVVTYKQDLKNSTESDTDSDSVIIIGDSENDKSRASWPSYFEKKLNNILRKPYDEKEYDSLMEKAHKRLPKEGHRDMRGGRLGTYKKDSLGKSWLDHHQDVAKAIKECRGDRQKILCILRGFIFWLEHKTHDDAFMPWKRKEYAEVQPRRSSLRNVIKAEAY